MEEATQKIQAIYRENLIEVLRGAREDYRQITFDRPTAQLSHLKNYLWLSLSIMTAELAVYSGIYSGTGFSLPWRVTPNMDFYALAFFAISFLVVAFCLAVDTCRGKHSTIYPADVWADYVALSWQEANGQTQENQVYISMLEQLRRGYRASSKSGHRKRRTAKKYIMAYSYLYMGYLHYR